VAAGLLRVASVAITRHTESMTRRCALRRSCWLLRATLRRICAADRGNARQAAFDGSVEKFKSPEAMQSALNDEEAKQKEKIDRDMREDIEHCGKDGRVQLNRAHHLIQQHNLTVNK
jgi:hypothetical protein